MNLNIIQKIEIMYHILNHNNNYYKKNFKLKILLFDLIEFYFRKINSSFSIDLMNKYSYFLKRISDTKKYNLDEEALFIEFTEEILNG